MIPRPVPAWCGPNGVIIEKIDCAFETISADVSNLELFQQTRDVAHYIVEQMSCCGC